jgi:hypothetical protein
LKEWTCVQVNHHKEVSRVIAEYQKEGWQVFDYEAAGSPTAVNHYLLFEREASAT